MSKYVVTENNGGGLSLYVLDGNKVIFAHSGYEAMNRGSLLADLKELDNCGDTSTWEGNEDGGQEAYEADMASEYGCKIVADNLSGRRKVYRDRMGAAARIEFGIR